MNVDTFEIVIPGVNTECGLRLCSGKKKLYVQSLRLFAASIPAVLAGIHAFFQIPDITEKDLKNFSTGVHSIKSMCDYIGAEDARKTARQLEDMADSGDLKGVLDQSDDFLKQIEKIAGSVQIWLDNNGDLIGAMPNTERNNG